MKRIIFVVCLLFAFNVIPEQGKAFFSSAIEQKAPNLTPPGVLRGSAYDSDLGIWLSFYADDYSTTEILGTEINSDFWVTDGYFYWVGSVQYVNAAIYTAGGIIYYNGPIS